MQGRLMQISNKLLLMVLIPLSILGACTFFAASMLHKTEKMTREYFSDYENRRILIAKIYENLGYGKGIHSFKNYVLRQTENYKIEAETDFLKAKQLILHYQTLSPLSSEEKRAMSTLLKTVEGYLEKIPVAEDLIAKKASIQALDQAVKVNDRPAISHIQALEESFAEHREEKLSQLTYLREVTFMSVIGAFFLAFLIAALVSKMIADKMRRSIKSLTKIADQISQGNYQIPLEGNFSDLSEAELHTLGKKMIEMGKNLDHAFHKLKQSNQDLEQFAFIAAHDIQEPLKKISVFTDFLEQDLEGELDDSRRENLKKIKEASYRSLTLIEALLNYSRLSEANPQFAKIDLNKTVAASLSNLELLIRESDVEICKPYLPKVLGDEAMLETLFQNLVSNAIKYRHPERKGKIEIIPEKKGRDSWKIHVKDNGIGFDMKYSEKILQPFGRAHNKKQYPGTGIGLATCARILTLHNSKIQVQAKEGEGADFSFELPERN